MFSDFPSAFSQKEVFDIMEDNAFSLKCDAQAVKVHYDNGEHISVIKVYPEEKSDIRIIFGRHRVTINDGKSSSRQKK